MRNGHIQSAKTELERLQKQGNTAANKRAAEQRADQGNKSCDTPLYGKEKGDTVFTDAAVRKGVRILLEQSLSQQIFYICSIKFQKNTKNPPLRKWIGTI